MKTPGEDHIAIASITDVALSDAVDTNCSSRTSSNKASQVLYTVGRSASVSCGSANIFCESIGNRRWRQ